MSKHRKRRDPFKLVLGLTVLFTVLAVGLFVGNQMLLRARDNELKALQDQVRAENTEAEQRYASQLAEFRSQDSGGVNLAWPVQKSEGWDIIDLTTFPLEEPFTSTIQRQDAMYNGMLLVNQWHPRPSDFNEDAVESAGRASGKVIRVANNNVRLLPSAVSAWTQLFTDAKVQKGYEYYMLQSAYRSYADQEKLFNEEKDKIKSRYTDEEELNEATRKRGVSYPGESDFNSGLSATVRLYHADDAAVNQKDNNFFSSDEGLWMLENAWRYGFVFRFPLADYPVAGTADKAYKTGISSRLRSFRYVGKGNAAVMQLKDFCLEEYIDYLAEHPHIAVFEDGRLRYEIYRQYVGDGDPFEVQLTGKPGIKETTTSLDNMGWAVSVFEY